MTVNFTHVHELYGKKILDGQKKMEPVWIKQIDPLCPYTPKELFAIITSKDVVFDVDTFNNGLAFYQGARSMPRRMVGTRYLVVNLINFNYNISQLFVMHLEQFGKTEGVYERQGKIPDIKRHAHNFYPILEADIVADACAENVEQVVVPIRQSVVLETTGSLSSIEVKPYEPVEAIVEQHGLIAISDVIGGSVKIDSLCVCPIDKPQECHHSYVLTSMTKKAEVTYGVPITDSEIRGSEALVPITYTLNDDKPYQTIRPSVMIKSDDIPRNVMFSLLQRIGFTGLYWSDYHNLNRLAHLLIDADKVKIVRTLMSVDISWFMRAWAVLSSLHVGVHKSLFHVMPRARFFGFDVADTTYNAKIAIRGPIAQGIFAVLQCYDGFVRVTGVNRTHVLLPIAMMSYKDATNMVMTPLSRKRIYMKEYYEKLNIVPNNSFNIDLVIIYVESVSGYSIVVMDVSSIKMVYDAYLVDPCFLQPFAMKLYKIAAFCVMYQVTNVIVDAEYNNIRLYQTILFDNFRTDNVQDVINFTHRACVDEMVAVVCKDFVFKSQRRTIDHHRAVIKEGNHVDLLTFDWIYYRPKNKKRKYSQKAFIDFSECSGIWTTMIMDTVNGCLMPDVSLVHTYFPLSS